MSRGELADDLRRFVLTSVPSVPYLEAILLLRSEADVAWDPARVARRLYVSDRQAAELLGQLTDAAIARAQPEGGWRYAPATPELRDRLDRLAQAYAADLVGVTDLIHSRIDKRAQQFADAFRLRKDS